MRVGRANTTAIQKKEGGTCTAKPGLAEPQRLEMSRQAGGGPHWKLRGSMDPPVRTPH